MEEPTNDQTNPMEHPTAEEELGQTKQSTIEDPEKVPPEGDSPGGVKIGISETPKKKSISPEMEVELKRLLRGTNRGRGLMVRLDAIGRPDLYKNSTQILWVKDIQSIDIKVQPFDLNPGSFEQFREYCWNNNMAYRFDDKAGALVLIVRWFLPDVLPIMDLELSKFAMAEPVKQEQAKPDLKEVK